MVIMALAVKSLTEYFMQAADEGMLQSGDNVGPTLLGAEAALRVVAEQLPKIVPNMLINKRDGKRRCMHACCSARVSFETVQSSHMAHVCTNYMFTSGSYSGRIPCQPNV